MSRRLYNKSLQFRCCFFPQAVVKWGREQSRSRYSQCLWSSDKSKLCSWSHALGWLWGLPLPATSIESVPRKLLLASSMWTITALPVDTWQVCAYLYLYQSGASYPSLSGGSSVFLAFRKRLLKAIHPAWIPHHRHDDERLYLLRNYVEPSTEQSMGSLGWVTNHYTIEWTLSLQEEQRCLNIFLGGNRSKGLAFHLYDPCLSSNVSKYYLSLFTRKGNWGSQPENKVNFPYDYYLLGTISVVPDHFRVMYVSLAYAHWISPHG